MLPSQIEAHPSKVLKEPSVIATGEPLFEIDPGAVSKIPDIGFSLPKQAGLHNYQNKGEQEYVLRRSHCLFLPRYGRLYRKSSFLASIF